MLIDIRSGINVLIESLLMVFNNQNRNYPVQNVPYNVFCVSYGTVLKKNVWTPSIWLFGYSKHALKCRPQTAKYAIYGSITAVRTTELRTFLSLAELFGPNFITFLLINQSKSNLSYTKDQGGMTKMLVQI